MCVVKSKSYIQWTSYTNLSGTLDIQYKFVWYNDNHIQNCAVQRKSEKHLCDTTEILHKLVWYDRTPMKSHTNLCGLFVC